MTIAATHPDVRPATRRRARPPRLDIGIAAVFVVLTVLEATLNGVIDSPVVHVLVAGTAMAAVAWRRMYPIPVALVAVLSNLVINPNHEFSSLLCLVLLSYTIGVETERPRSILGLGVILVPFVGGMAMRGLVPSDVAAALVFLVGPWSVGVAVRERTARAAEAIARADRLVAEERTRIARELHDIVSHSISVVTIQTQAVRRRLGADHQKEAADLAAVEATAREALAEMRRLFGVLRAEGEQVSLAPQPGLDQLQRLVDQVHSGTLTARLVVEGDPYPLQPGVDLAAYRIAQEGLTNAIRHSGAATVTVRVAYEPTAVRVEVVDDGRGLRGHTEGGHGLVGIRERVALYDGVVELREAPGGGAVLSARLPVREAS